MAIRNRIFVATLCLGAFVNALLLGGTGAMGRYLSALFARSGVHVAVTSRSDRSGKDGVEFLKGNAKDAPFLKDALSSHAWDFVVDFMIWSTDEFRSRRDLLLDSCGQYIFLSSYRVFAASPVVREVSPRLLDACGDSEYLATDEYALAKARQEDLLRASGRSNWTIVRPAITYSRGRHQLGVLECYEWLPRVLSGHAVPMPKEMLDAQATMTWGGDVACMIFRLCGNPGALGEDFNACTSRHRSWREVVEAYRTYVPLEVRECPLGEYLKRVPRTYQIRYDRLVDRVMDNSKALSVCGLREGELLSLEKGFEREFGAYLEAPGEGRRGGARLQGRLDRLTGEFYSPWSFPEDGVAKPYLKYLYGRLIS